MRLLGPQWIVLYLYLAGALYIHFRGRERHRFLRQLADHSTILAPFNLFVYLLSAVPRTPLVRLEDFPELTAVGENWELIRDEALSLYDANLIASARAHNDVAFDSLYRRGWKRFYFKWYGRFLPSAERYCPETVKLLSSVEGMNAAMLTLLPPYSKLGRHRDPYAGSLRYHLGLVTPNSDDCRIFVDGERYSWRDGEGFMFDETYIHWAENNTDQTRIILFCDIERPLRYRWAQWINRMFRSVLGPATATENVPGDGVGIVNRLFQVLYYARIAGTKLKNASPLLYKTVKLSIVALLVYVIFF